MFIHYVVSMASVPSLGLWTLWLTFLAAIALIYPDCFFSTRLRPLAALYKLYPSTVVSHKMRHYSGLILEFLILLNFSEPSNMQCPHSVAVGYISRYRSTAECAIVFVVFSLLTDRSAYPLTHEDTDWSIDLSAVN